jgi:hypothetical protein
MMRKASSLTRSHNAESRPAVERLSLIHKICRGSRRTAYPPGRDGRALCQKLAAGVIRNERPALWLSDRNPIRRLVSEIA